MEALSDASQTKTVPGTPHSALTLPLCFWRCNSASFVWFPLGCSLGLGVCVLFCWSFSFSFCVSGMMTSARNVLSGIHRMENFFNPVENLGSATPVTDINSVSLSIDCALLLQTQSLTAQKTGVIQIPHRHHTDTVQSGTQPAHMPGCVWVSYLSLQLHNYTSTSHFVLCISCRRSTDPEFSPILPTTAADG